MSGFSSIALPGRIPTAGSGRNDITPESLFSSEKERSEYDRILSGSQSDPNFCVKKVRVEIFDLSDKKQVRKYEKLWKELLEKSARMEVVVDSGKNLVQRKDGTSYWMKYVEYVEFSEKGGRSGK